MRDAATRRAAHGDAILSLWVAQARMSHAPCRFEFRCRQRRFRHAQPMPASRPLTRRSFPRYATL